jgi:hypothetical protein
VSGSRAPSRSARASATITPRAPCGLVLCLASIGSARSHFLHDREQAVLACAIPGERVVLLDLARTPRHPYYCPVPAHTR